MADCKRECKINVRGEMWTRIREHSRSLRVWAGHWIARMDTQDLSTQQTREEGRDISSMHEKSLSEELQLNLDEVSSAHHN